MRTAVFLAITCMDTQPYINYDEPITGEYEQKIPRVLLIMRWDGKFGFPGGWVDEGETPEQALIRELREEINFIVFRGDFKQVHEEIVGERRTLLYHMNVTVEHLKGILNFASGAKHYDSEVCGIVTPNLVPGSIEHMWQLPFAYSAGHQLEILLRGLGIIPLK
jgi:8-oxo-dGTP pyrophosphatase MutT (NUDIX family)